MGAAPDRLTRVNELIKREISDLIYRNSVSPSASVLVSVTEVRTSVDLRNATVSVSIVGGDNAARAEVFRMLNAKRVDFQKHLARHLAFKHTPVLMFRIDNRVAAGDRVLELLAEMEHSNTTEDGDDNE